MAQVRLDIGVDGPYGLHSAHCGELMRLTLAAGGDRANHFATPAGPPMPAVQIGFAGVATATGRSLVSAFVRSGIDPNAAAPAIEFVFGNGSYLQHGPWSDPLPKVQQAAVPSGLTDGEPVMLHALGHALGFNGWRDASGGALFVAGASARARCGAAQPLTPGNQGHLGHRGRGRRPGADAGPDARLVRRARRALCDLGTGPRPAAQPRPDDGRDGAGGGTLLLLLLLGLAALGQRRWPRPRHGVLVSVRWHTDAPAAPIQTRRMDNTTRERDHESPY